MKNRLFLALLVCCSIFTFGTRASDGATNRVPPPPEVLSQKVVTPDGVSIGIAEKNVALPQVFPSTVFSFSLNKQATKEKKQKKVARVILPILYITQNKR